MPDFSTKQRENLAEKGQAMPHGGFPIRNRADLKRAIQAFGRARDKAATKAWIIKRAKALNAMDLLPESWTSKEGSAHMDPVDEFLIHYGVKGMRWEQRKRSDDSGGDSGPSRKEKRQARNVEILEARNRQRIRENAIGDAEVKLYTAQNKAGRQAAQKVLQDLEKDYYLSADYKTSKKYTSGEKVATALVFGVAGASVLTSVSGRR